MRWISSQGLRPLHDYVVVVVSVVVVCWDWFRLTSRGVLPRTPFTYYVFCISLSMCVGLRLTLCALCPGAGCLVFLGGVW